MGCVFTLSLPQDPNTPVPYYLTFDNATRNLCVKDNTGTTLNCVTIPAGDEPQMLSLNNNTLSISNGNSIVLPAIPTINVISATLQTNQSGQYGQNINIELQPSQQAGNALVIGNDGLPYVPKAGSNANISTNLGNLTKLGTDGGVLTQEGDVANALLDDDAFVTEINSNVTKELLGLENVNNTSDANKPISTAQQTALNTKENLSNKASIIDATNRDSTTQYASTKAVFNAVQDAMGNSIIGSALPTDSPSGTETNGQSYRVSNSKDIPDPDDGSNDDTYTNFLTNVSDGSGGFLPVKVPAKTSGLIIKNADGWAFVPNAVDTSDLATKQEVGEKLDQSSVKFDVEDLFRSGTILDNTIVNSLGNIVPATDYKSVFIDLSGHDKLTISGITPAAGGVNKYYVYDSGEFAPIGSAVKTLNIPPTATRITFCFQSPSEGDITPVVVYGTTIPAEFNVTEINGGKVLNLEQVKSLLPEINYSGVKNLYNPSLLFDLYFVSTDNTIHKSQSGGNWKTAAITLDHSDPATTSNVAISGWLCSQVKMILGTGTPPVEGADLLYFNDQISSVFNAVKSNGSATFSVTPDITWIAFTPSGAADTEDMYKNLNVQMGTAVDPDSDIRVNGLNGNEIVAAGLQSSDGSFYPTDQIINSINNSDSIKLTIDPSSALAGAVLEFQYKGDLYTKTLAPFRPWSHVDSNVFDYKDFTKNGEVLHTGVDAVSPIQMKGTDFLGNHAWNGMNVTCVGHGKSFVDVGSKWTWNGLEVQIMAITDANHLQLSKTADNGTISALGTITHVAGATNTGSFTITASSVVRTCPSLKDRVMNIFVDGAQINTSIAGTYNGRKIEFAESYLGLDKKSIHDWLFTQVGTPTEITNFDGTPIVARTFVYTFYPDLTNVVPANETSLVDEESFQSYMLAQTQQLSGTVKICLPKTKPILWNGTTTDFNLLTELPATMPGVITITGNDVLPEGIIADRMIQISESIGLAIGVLPLFDQDENARRLSAINKALYISNPKKQYLYGLSSPDITTRAKGDVFSYVFYKAYFPLQNGRTAKYVIEYGDSYYLYLLWHETITDHIELDGRLAGKSFDVLEKSDNVTVLTKIGGATLIADVEAEGSYGYLTLKFNK
jgi:hypothetical protein